MVTIKRGGGLSRGGGVGFTQFRAVLLRGGGGGFDGGFCWLGSLGGGGGGPDGGGGLLGLGGAAEGGGGTEGGGGLACRQVAHVVSVHSYYELSMICQETSSPKYNWNDRVGARQTSAM